MFGANYFGQLYFAQAYGVRGILFDNASNSGYKASVSSYNWTHINGGSSQTLIVNVSLFATGSVSSITYNSVALTKIRTDSVGVYRNEMWYLANPAYGSHSIAVTLNTSLTSIASATSYSNTDISNTPIEENAGSTGSGVSTPTVTITPDSAYAWIVDGLTSSNTTETVGANQTQRDNNTGVLGTGAMSDKGPIVTPTSTSMTWSAVGLTDSWAYGVIALDPANNTAYSLTFPATYQTSGILTVLNLTRSLTATYSNSGVLNRLISYKIIATYQITGVFFKRTVRIFNASYSAQGRVATIAFVRIFTANFKTNGQIVVNNITRTLSAAYKVAGNLAKNTSRQFTSSIYIVGGNLSKSLNRSFLATFRGVGLLYGIIPPAWNYIKVLITSLTENATLSDSNTTATMNSSATIETINDTDQNVIIKG